MSYCPHHPSNWCTDPECKTADKCLHEEAKKQHAEQAHPPLVDHDKPKAE